MYVLVDLTFTDVMSSNITVYSRRNTTLTVGTIWTHITCAWTNPLSCINICKYTGLTILCNKNPTFFLYFKI